MPSDDAPRPNSVGVGPYLVVAVICEDIIEEKDGRLTLVRLSTDAVVTAEGPDAPEKMPTTEVPLIALVTFTAGGRPGNYTMHVDIERPDGTRRRSMPIAVDLKHEHFTVNSILRGTFEVHAPGVHWMVVEFEGREVTRTPIFVRYERKSVESPQNAADEARS